MRTHSQIVRDVGAAELAALTKAALPTVYSWSQRNSIPADQWLALVENDHATADELMAGAVKEKVA